MIEFLTFYQDLGLLLVRLAVGVIFLAHGMGKWKSLEGTGQGFESMGFRPGKFWATIVALAETLGGLAILLGFYMQWGALIVAAVMLVAFLWKLGRGQQLVGGYELDMVLLAIALYLATMASGGSYSLDMYLL